MSYTHIYDSSKLEAFMHRNPVTTAETSVEDNSVVRWDVGSLINIQDSSILIDDEGDIVIPTGSNVVFEDTGNLTFTESGGSDTVTIKGAGSIGVNHRLVLPGITGATGNALAVESIVGDELRLSWEEQTSLGPGSNVTDNAIVRWDGTSGNKIKNSSILANDNDGITIPVSYNLVFNNTGPVVFKEVGGSNTLKLQSNDSLIGNTVLTLPNSAGTSSQVLTTDGSDVATLSWGSAPSFASIDPVVPKYDFSNYSQTGLNEYLRLNQGYNSTATGAYTHGATVVSAGYNYGVYAPTLNRIYFCPLAQADEGSGATSEWHYLDCSNGSIVLYDTGIAKGAFINAAYVGGAYSPTENRIYFAPYAQSNQSTWHYIDCSDGSVVGYAHGLGASGPVLYGYQNAVYSPLQNRIYLTPFAQSNQTWWHYIDCSDGTVKVYGHSGVTTPIAEGYDGGCYSPTENRIYFAPTRQGPQTWWHYIDCDDGSVGEYGHDADTIADYAYLGAVYSPLQNRIYFTPLNQTVNPDWHYIDCDTGTAVTYQHGMGNFGGGNGGRYCGGAYFPPHNRIYLSPFAYATRGTEWHYIDCSNGGVTGYVTNFPTSEFANNSYRGAVVSPTQNRLYFIPDGQCTRTEWHYISDINATGMNTVSKVLMSGSLFNQGA